ncbi:hypothetical protein ABZU76_14570 [Amycolatopsis sp. NPDC005232]|uniref:hypothetical protein n=1 Tax=Amycolatopsis sp. NPDC005232 TaxID=3157027 RepID=UPI0033A9145F
MGQDATGFHVKYLPTGSGYYSDVGCSEMLVCHEIGLAHARAMDRFVPEGVRCKDVTVIPVAVVVLGTGFGTPVATIRRLGRRALGVPTMTDS